MDKMAVFALLAVSIVATLATAEHLPVAEHKLPEGATDDDFCWGRGSNVDFEASMRAEILREGLSVVDEEKCKELCREAHPDCKMILYDSSGRECHRVDIEGIKHASEFQEKSGTDILAYDKCGSIASYAKRIEMDPLKFTLTKA